MIVVDSSALLCLLLGEPESERVAATLETSVSNAIPAPVLLEAEIVAEARLGPQGAVNLRSVMDTAAIEVLPFGLREERVAMRAWRCFGTGNHRASLNYGACMAYACAKDLDAPLLFVGDDFPHTDVVPA